MRYRHILLTGGSGKLGKAIRSSGSFPTLIAPSHTALDLAKLSTIECFFKANRVDAVIHCAAMARMAECERDGVGAIVTNIVGTSLLVQEVMHNERRTGKPIRFIYISTDGVYAGTEGHYKENSPTIPYNRYGWTKLGGECAVRLLKDHCIVRTGFFDPDHIPFDDSAFDAYSSKVEIGYLARAIAVMLESNFVGVINFGGERMSDYARYSTYKPNLKRCRLKDIVRRVSFPMAKDASLDSSLLKKIEKRALKRHI